MADYKESQGVKTQRDNEFKIKLVDGQSGTSASKSVTVASNGDTITPGTNDYGVPIFGRTSDGKLRLISLDTAGNVNAVIGNPSGAAVVSDQAISANVAPAASANHDKVITSGKSATKISAQCTSLGLIKWQLGTWDGTAFTEIVRGYTSPSTPYVTLATMQMPTGDGTLAVRVIATNEDATANDATSTMEWVEE